MHHGQALAVVGARLLDLGHAKLHGDDARDLVEVEVEEGGVVDKGEDLAHVSQPVHIW